MWTQLCILLQIPHLTSGETRTDSDTRSFRSSGWRFTQTYCHFSGTSLLGLQGLPVPVRTTSSLPISLKFTGLTAWARVPMDILLSKLEILQPGFLKSVSLCGRGPLPLLLWKRHLFCSWTISVDWVFSLFLWRQLALVFRILVSCCSWSCSSTVDPLVSFLAVRKNWWQAWSKMPQWYGAAKVNHHWQEAGAAALKLFLFFDESIL